MAYKLRKGVDRLHLGGGLFFYDNETYNDKDMKKVSKAMKNKYFKETAENKAEVESNDNADDANKINADNADDEQTTLIPDMGGE